MSDITSNNACEPPRECRYCGSKEVYWVFTGVRWKLMDDETDKPHICEANADGFEDLTK